MATAEQQQQAPSSLQVCLRVKQNENNDGENNYVIADDKTLRVKTLRGIEIYNFSHIFSIESTQEEVFEHTAGCSVLDFLCGNDCLVFAHGTTNAGKTYTVQGNLNKPGIVPRTLSGIFNAIKNYIDSSPVIAPCNYATTQIRGLKDRKKTEELRSHLLEWTNRAVAPISFPRLANCSVSFCPSLSSTLSPDTYPDIYIEKDDHSYVDMGWEAATRCSLWISMIEVYNENVFDLLSSNKFNSKLTITQDMENRFYPSGQIEVNVNSLKEALGVIHYGNKQRQKSSTKLNNTSSRSHCILRLRLVRADRTAMSPMNVGPQSPAACDIQDTHVSTFMICDLAGSERSNKIGSALGRARETANINTSLVVLGRCIEALQLKGNSTNTLSARHIIVPFRDSKLTKILQPLLTIPGPKHLLVNISTSPRLLDETLNVLKFSAVARKVVVAEPIRAIPRYQLPKQSKQLQELYLMPEVTIASVAEGVETIMEEEEVNNRGESEYLAYMEKKSTQTDVEEVGQTVEDWMRQIEELKRTIAKNLAEYSDDRKRMIESYNKLEQGMLENHHEQMKDKECQLYTLMHERLELQEQFYKNELKTASTKITRQTEELKRTIAKNLAEYSDDREHMIESYNKLEKEMIENHQEQMKDKECQLYTLMHERLKLQEEFYKDELKTASTKITLLKEELKEAKTHQEAAERACVQAQAAKQVSEEELKSMMAENKLLGIKLNAKEIIHHFSEERFIQLTLNYEKTNTELIDATNKIKSLEKNVKELTEANKTLTNNVKSYEVALKAQAEASAQEIEKLEANTKATLNRLTEERKKVEHLESNFKEYKSSNQDLISKIEATESELQRFKEMMSFLVYQFKPDVRHSVAGCAEEETTWVELEKELQSLPRECTNLKERNRDLEEQLLLKEKDMEKFKNCRDELFKKYDKELNASKTIIEDLKRENVVLLKQINLTPHKQENITPLKEFKTPLTPRQLRTSYHNDSAAKVDAQIKDEAPNDTGSQTGSVRRRRTRQTPAKKPEIARNILHVCDEISDNQENIAQKPRRRRHLKNPQHPALDSEEMIHVELQTTSQLQETKMKLRTKYK